MANQSITIKHSTGVIVSNPYAKVSIYTETGGLIISQDLNVATTDLNKDILSMSTNRDMANDCPTFTITLTWRNDWYNRIGPNDLVIIQMTRPPEKEDEVMFGLVDDVRKNADYNNKSVNRSLTLTGRGFCKAMLNFTIGTINEINANAEIMGFMPNHSSILQGVTPGEAIGNVLNHYVKQGCDYHFKNGKSYTSYYKYLMHNVKDNSERLVDCSTFLTYQGSLWDYLKELQNAPFNELYWEIINHRPTLVFRPTPFNKDDWTALYRIEIKDFNVINENLGLSDLETYTVYKVVSETFATDTANLGFLPLWYQPYYSKYGLTRLEIQSKYMTDDNSVTKTRDLFNWNILNNSMRNGTVVVAGSNQFKVGNRVIFESDGIEYYIEAVSHNFTNYTGWTTTLQLTRGIDPSLRYNKPWGEYSELTPSMLSSIFGFELTKVADVEQQTEQTRSSTVAAAVNSAGDVPKAVWNALKAMGYSDIAAAGAMGNIDWESSGFNPAIIEGGSGEGLGLCQWSFGRKTQLKSYAASTGRSATDPAVQVEFLMMELTKGGVKGVADYQLLNNMGESADSWKNATDVDAATRAFCFSFERPNVAKAHISERQSRAQGWYNAYAGG
jgi:hypothetical protein